MFLFGVAGVLNECSGVHVCVVWQVYTLSVKE